MSESVTIIVYMLEQVSASKGRPRLMTEDLSAFIDDLALIRLPQTDAGIVEQLDALERVKAAAAAAQARLAHSLQRTQPKQDPASIGAQLGLARRESPHRGGRLLDLARALIDDLPQTLAALTAGDISEARALIIASETGQLGPDDRRAADLEIFPTAAELGDARLRDHVRAVALRLDDEAATRRQLQARGNRRVTGRLLGDGTGRITTVVKQEHFAAVLHAMDAVADAARAAGDPRTYGQVKADTLVERVTGIDTTAPVPVRVDLVLDAETLLGDSPEPGRIPGAGPVPATLARLLIREASSAGRATLRRLYAAPATNELVALESHRRTFPRGLADLIDRRDAGICRTPYCNAPIRHHDHVVPAREDGPTDADNGQGLCERCNYVKESPGWVQWVDTTHGRHQVGILTPAHHVYSSNAPPLPRAPARAPRSRLETFFAEIVLAA